MQATFSTFFIFVLIVGSFHSPATAQNKLKSHALLFLEAEGGESSYRFVGTTRDVEAWYLMKLFLEKNLLPESRSQFRDLEIESEDLLLSAILSEEANQFNVAQVSRKKIEPDAKRIFSALLAHPRGKTLDLNQEEVIKLYSLLVQSRAFLELKLQATVSVVTDEEVETALLNRKKEALDGSPGLAKAQDLVRNQVFEAIQREKRQTRLIEWLGLLKKKYGSRNVLREGLDPSLFL